MKNPDVGVPGTPSSLSANAPPVVIPPADPDRFLRQLLSSMVEFRAGDFTTRMPSDLTGLPGKVADVFNDIVSVSHRRSTETTRVTRVVGKEGKLKERMSVPGASGAWSDEIRSINTLIDDLAWPTTEVTRAVGAVAKGDLSQSVSLEVDGRP